MLRRLPDGSNRRFSSSCAMLSEDVLLAYHHFGFDGFLHHVLMQITRNNNTYTSHRAYLFKFDDNELHHKQLLPQDPPAPQLATTISLRVVGLTHQAFRMKTHKRRSASHNLHRNHERRTLYVCVCKPCAKLNTFNSIPRSSKCVQLRHAACTDNAERGRGGPVLLQWGRPSPPLPPSLRKQEAINVIELCVIIYETR